MNSVRRFRLFGLEIDSQFDLIPQCVEAIAQADVKIHSGAVPPFARTSEKDEFVRLNALGSFHIHAGQEIIAALHKDAPVDLLRVFLSGRAMAYLLRQRGWLPLHASAVEIDGRAILFVAPSGSGKSTTAAAFQNFDYPVLSDDVCPVRVAAGACWLQPGRPGLRLGEMSARKFGHLDQGAEFVLDKFDFTFPGAFRPGLVEVAAIYLLEDGAEFRIEPLPPLAAAVALGRECFVRLPQAGPEVRVSHLRWSAELACLPLTRRLTRPRDLDQIGKIIDLVVSDLDQSIAA